MDIEKNDFGFKIPKFIKISGIIVFVISMTIYMRYWTNKNNADNEFFYKENVNGVIEKIGLGSGGWYSVHTTDGNVFRFCPSESYIDKKITKGDTIFKPSFMDTVFIRNNKKTLKITFLK